MHFKRGIDIGKYKQTAISSIMKEIAIVETKEVRFHN
jgi:hypothetical protein